MTFDITDGKNRYAPCPECGAGIGMGLSWSGWTKKGGTPTLAVQCFACATRGPEITGEPSTSTDKAAFDAWNAMSRPLDGQGLESK